MEGLLACFLSSLLLKLLLVLTRRGGGQAGDRLGSRDSSGFRDSEGKGRKKAREHKQNDITSSHTDIRKLLIENRIRWISQMNVLEQRWFWVSLRVARHPSYYIAVAASACQAWSLKE